MTKNIVLCSDGTGNKGGAGNDSNVYKLYQSIDLNHSTEQISFYDNGVGTKKDGSAVKSNKIWVALSGAFGLGFNDKVRDLYEFLSCQYQTGDKIYIFGFSRGAATVRAFTGFVHNCGLLDKSKTESEADFQQRINDAMDAYREIKTKPETAAEFKKSYAIQNADHAPDGNLNIHFVGVWDTVSALGFPDGSWKTNDLFFKALDKLSDGLEKWSDKRWPHQFYDYKLNDDVLYACQALAIDDERKTFHPKLWNETQRSPESVDQVWFAGAHSNIGGGYPRSGLSNVTLDWMYKKASAHGLIFVNDDVSAISAHANVQGKLYNSRDGFGIYYRYEPRNIEKLCISQTTKTAKIEPGKIKLHDSVINRVKQGTALYSPFMLPEKFEVVSTDSNGAKPIAFNQQQWQACQQEAEQWVDKLQSLYRRFIEISLVFLVSAIVLWICPTDSIKDFLLQESTQSLSACQAFKEIQCFPEKYSLFWPFTWIYSLLSYILPALFKNFIVFVVCIHPYIVVVMFAGFYFLVRKNSQYKASLSKAKAKTRLLLLKTFQDI